MPLPLPSYRAMPTAAPGESDVANERRYRASLEDSLRNARLALEQTDTLLQQTDERLQQLEDNATFWEGEWAPGTYQKNAMVTDGSYLMVANKITEERPAPVRVGEGRFLYAGLNPTAPITAKSVLYGVAYKPDAGGYFFVDKWRAYTITGNTYRVYTETNGVINESRNFEAQITGWTEFTAAGRLIAPGDDFSVFVEVREPDPTPTVFTLSYNYITPNNAATPLAGQITHANKALSSLRVNKEDTAGDQSAQLAQMTVGDVIEGAGVRWSISNITDEGTWIDFSVAPGVQGFPDGVQDFTFETVVATPITVLADVDYWATDLAISGFYSIDNAPLVETQSAYGIDIFAVPADVSEDWDVMSLTHSGYELT